MSGICRNCASIFSRDFLSSGRCEASSVHAFIKLSSTLTAVSVTNTFGIRALFANFCRAVLVHAIDAEAAAFYRKYGFESCPGFELHLMLLMKDLRATLGV